MNAHKEPWLADKTATAIYIKTDEGNLVCIEELYSIYPTKREYMESKFKRIVECVNACAGIENPGEAIASARTHLEKIVRDRYADPASCADPSHLAQLALIELTPKA